jgi:NAD(P)-dependent dehydrogenase (short-subunit alcohol dehydrogenase family)
MPTALIIGASRGIGNELARQYKIDGWRVIATARRAIRSPPSAGRSTAR